MPAAIGAAAEVPVCSLVQLFPMSVVVTFPSDLLPLENVLASVEAHFSPYQGNELPERRALKKRTFRIAD